MLSITSFAAFVVMLSLAAFVAANLNPLWEAIWGSSIPEWTCTGSEGVCGPCAGAVELTYSPPAGATPVHEAQLARAEARATLTRSRVKYPVLVITRARVARESADLVAHRAQLLLRQWVEATPIPAPQRRRERLLDLTL